MSNQSENNHQDSFYSIDNNKSQFTFVQELPMQPANQIVQAFDIRQSSALSISSNLLNKSIASEQPIGLDDISQIHAPQMDELSCSMCLQKQIDSLTVPNQPTQQELKQLQDNISRLRKDQSILKQKIQIFQGIMTFTKNNNENISKALIQANKFTKKSCEHSGSGQPFNIPWPNSNQLTLKQLRQPQNQRAFNKHKQQHFDIKPNRSQSASQRQANNLYKRASLQRQIILLDDTQNQYRIEVQYQKQHIKLEVINYQKGQNNFIYAARILDKILGSQKISQKFSIPLAKYEPKKFTLTVSVVLLIFKHGLQKQEKNLLQAEQVRSISLPLPISCFISSRFANGGVKLDLLQKLQKKLYVYQIDINYGVDNLIHKEMSVLQWVKNRWISLKGSKQVLWLDLGEVSESADGFRAVFRVGTKQRDCHIFASCWLFDLLYEFICNTLS